jgi:phenylacetate-coenzyme A ligase PaaK-like adenylate-forming protein
LISQESLMHKLNDVQRHFPWYADLIRERRIERLEDLPLITPDLLEKHYYNQPGDPALQVYRTSGTGSKKRKKIFYSAEDDRNYINLKVKIFGDFLKGSSIKKAAADMGTGHAASTAVTVFEQLQLETLSISFESPIDEHVNRLKRFQPDVLYTMPSILDHLLIESDDPVQWGIRKLILVGEIASEQWRKNVARRLRIDTKDILDTLGSIEIGTIAYFSHEHDRYIVVDDIVAEGLPAEEVDPGNEGLSDSEKVLLLTSLNRSLFPAIRFVTYDVVRDFRTIEVNGRPRQSFQSIVKRIGPELKHGEKISIYDIEEVVYKYADDARVRVKVRNNTLAVEIQSKTTINEALTKVIQQEIQRRIPEIGTMIQNRILDEIAVVIVSEDLPWSTGSIKNKKIYYE